MLFAKNSVAVHRFWVWEAHDQQSIEKQIKKTQSGYMRNQKKTYQMIQGKCLKAASTHSGLCGTLTQKNYTQTLRRSKKVYKRFYQRLADPATSAGKTGAFLPEEAPRQYPWEHGPIKTKIILILRLMLANMAYQKSALRTTLEINQSCRGYHHT